MARMTPLQTPAMQPEPHRHRPIDLVYLARHTSGDSGLERDVLRMFDQVSRTYCSRIQASCDIDEMKSTLSALKGAAGAIGAWGILELATSLEEVVKSQGKIEAEHIGDLDMAVHEASEFIGRMLKSGTI
jgi:HPt (histidine-containing phosphotransfer) domain-containing protein